MFDGRAFIRDEFGSPSAVLDLFDQYGLNGPEAATVQQWWRRSSVPGGWLARCLCLLEIEHGRPVSLAKYMTNGGRCGR